jgi:cytochrome P450
MDTPTLAPASPATAAVATRAYASVWGLRSIRRSPIGFLQHLASSGDVVDFSFRDQRAFLINDPRIIERILVTEQRRFMKPPALQRASRLLGQGLLTAADPLHTARRRLAQPAFHRHRIQEYGEVMSRRAAHMRDTWFEGTALDVHQALSTLTLSIVGDTLFSTDLTPFADTLRSVVARAIESFDPLVALVAPMRRLKPERERLGAVVDELIARRLSESGAGAGDLLDLLLAADPDGSSQQLHDDVSTVLLAGFDTISNALTWTWMFLADHPEIDAALGRELDTVLGGRLPGAADLPALPFARAVFNESLRLRPPAWILARLAIEPLALDQGEIPAGALVLMSPYLMHRDPRFFADSLSFTPARWLGEAAGSRPAFSFFPFGGGRRACIGESFALMEGVLVMATVGQQWQLRFPAAPDSRADVDPRITLRPRGPALMVPERRA